MGQRTFSLSLATVTLGAALWLYTRSLWAYGPTLIYPFVGAPAVAGMMVLRALVERGSQRAADPSARAIEVVALAMMLAPFIGTFVAFYCLADMGGDHCGLADASAVSTILGRSWPVWSVGEAVVLTAVTYRRGLLTRLRWRERAATILTLLVAPPVAVLACVATMQESARGGAGVTFLLPAASASAATAVAWGLGRSFAVATALRRLVAALMLIGTGVSFFLRLVAPLSHECTSFSTTTTWSMMSEFGWAVAPCFAVMLYFAHDPRHSTA